MSAALRRIHVQPSFSSRWLSRRCIHGASSLSSQARPSQSKYIGHDEGQTTSIEPKESTTRKTRRKSKKTANIDEDTVPTNTVQQHLDRFLQIDPQGSIALEDIERYRLPAKSKELNPHSPNYDHFFEETVNRLTQSFSLPQLRQFIELYGLVPPHQRTKAVLARFIMEEQWKYPSLEKVKQERIDWTEQEDLRAYQSFILAPSNS